MYHSTINPAILTILNAHRACGHYADVRQVVDGFEILVWETEDHAWEDTYRTNTINRYHIEG